MTLPTPPRYVVLPEEVIEQAYAPDKPRRALLASFTRILSLAWESKYARTPSMNEEELMAFLKLSRRQYFEQKADMELLGWLRSSHPVVGFVQFTFSRSIVASVAKQADEMVSAESRTADAGNRTEVRKTALESELIGGGVLIKDSINESTPPTLNGETSAKNRTDEKGELPSVVQILAETHLLFDGAVVISKGLEGRDPEDVLAWCAYVYSQKRTMSAPGGVVRNKLKENARPPEWSKIKWFDTLPESFLIALGLINPDPESDERDTALDRAAMSESEEQPTPEVTRVWLAPDDLQPEITLAWKKALMLLKLEMPRAAFESWVSDTQPVRYDGNTLTIGTPSSTVRDWLESRLTSTVQRMLVGLLNQQVAVVFVVTELVESE